MPKAAIIMGSKSDINICEKAADILKQFGVEVSVRVMSAHRTPDEVCSFAKNAEREGYEVLIAAAGKAAHLAGVIAANTTLPVIGIPVKSSAMDGLDSLLSTVQMPSGVPVATVAIDGGENAAILALQILGVKYGDIRQKLHEYKKQMALNVVSDDNEIKYKF